MIYAIAYSLFEICDQHCAILLSSALSAYSWANGILSAIPDYALIDGILAILTLFHISIAISFVAVYDAFYKKTLLKLHHNVVKVFFDNPLTISIFNVLAIITTVHLSYYAWNHNEDSKATLRAVFTIHTWACSIIMQRLSTILVKMGVDYCMRVEQDMEKKDIKTWQEPPVWTASLFAPLNWIIRPQVFGIENISTETPGFYVMNHALFGMEMAPFVASMFTVGNVFLRGLSDLTHFGQLHGEFIRYFGGVSGTRDNVDVLMENKQNVLVYPGGGHEIMKPSTVPRYTLMWKKRLGFARMAIKHGYPIVPCCSVGTEDMFTTIYDLDLGWVKKDQKLPISILRLDRLQKVYFWVGEPIPTDKYNGDFNNTEFAQELRDQTKAAVEAGIREMKERQANDPDRYSFTHIGNATKRMIGTVFGSTTTTPPGKTIEEPAPASKKID